MSNAECGMRNSTFITPHSALDGVLAVAGFVFRIWQKHAIVIYSVTLLGVLIAAILIQ